MNIYRLLHWFYFGRALARGPRYFTGYEARRQSRRAMWRLTRKWR